MMSSPNWLSRSDLGDEAQLVCDEMAHRARNNIEIIVERLSNDGYRFHSNDDEQTPRRRTYQRPQRQRSKRIGCRNASALHP